MKAALYTSAYVPAEWIVAHGFDPVRVAPSGRAEAPTALNREGVCPFLRAFLGDVLARRDAAAVVMTTTCDQMRRGFDLVTRAGLIPAFLLNVPRTQQSPSARRLYADELRRLGGFLTKLGGVPPSAERLAEMLLRCEDAGPATHESAAGVPVAVVGPALRREDVILFDILRACGGYVALDATEMGERGRHRDFDRRALTDDPVLELADAYLSGIVDVFARPNDAFYDWLGSRLRQRGIRAVILYRHTWCDLWHVEYGRLKARTGLPVLDLDAGGDGTPAVGRMRSRVGAFLEMLT